MEIFSGSPPDKSVSYLGRCHCFTHWTFKATMKQYLYVGLNYYYLFSTIFGTRWNKRRPFVKKQKSALTLSGTMMFGRTREGDMSMDFLCLGLCLSRSLCFWREEKEKQKGGTG